jgi:hypothetical protein
LVELLNSEQIAGAHSFKRRAPLLPRLRRAPDATPCAHGGSARSRVQQTAASSVTMTDVM